MATWPSNLEIGEGATPNELDIDKPITSSQSKRYRDRDGRLHNALRDGATAPFNLDVNGLTARGNLAVTGTSVLTGNVTAQGTLAVSGDLDVVGTLTAGVFVTPEVAMTFANL